MLHQKVTQLALGSDFTVVVTGDGDADNQESNLSAVSSHEQAGESWTCSPHIITAADLHLQEENKCSESKAEPTPSSTGSKSAVDQALTNSSGIEAPKREAVSQLLPTASGMCASGP